MWKSEHGLKQSSVHNSTKFKNPSLKRKDSYHLDVNDVGQVSNGLKQVLRPTPSIGQILSRKLLLTEDYKNGVQARRRKVSLGQMLSKPSSNQNSARKCGKENKEVGYKEEEVWVCSDIPLSGQAKQEEEEQRSCRFDASRLRVIAMLR